MATDTKPAPTIASITISVDWSVEEWGLDCTRGGLLMHAPAWMGLTCDHLIEDCPNRAKARPQLEIYGWWKQCIVLVDPDGGDLCGWCVRVWKARNKKPRLAEEA